MCAYISAWRIRFSQRCVTSIVALSSLWKRAWEWEINCQTMHSSHPLRFSSCQMISKHYRMSGCIIYCPRPHQTSHQHHHPRPSCTLWWICEPATKGSMKWQGFFHHFIFITLHSTLHTWTRVAWSRYWFDTLIRLLLFPLYGCNIKNYITVY